MNSVGIIDKGYRGNLFGCFDNISENLINSQGIRLLQICAPNLEPITMNWLKNLLKPLEKRRFGSTGQ